MNGGPLTLACLQMNAKSIVWMRQPAQVPGMNIEASQLLLPDSGLAGIGPEHGCAAIAHYLAAVGALKTPSADLPADMAASKGRLMLDVVSLLAGKSIIDKVGTSGLPCWLLKTLNHLQHLAPGATLRAR